MINSQLISFRNGFSPYYNNSFISTTRNAAEVITEVFTSPQLLSIIAIVTAIALVLGAYKLAICLGYFSLSYDGSFSPSAPPLEEEPIVFEVLSPTAPSIEQVFSESSSEMQEELFKQYPNFGSSS